MDNPVSAPVSDQKIAVDVIYIAIADKVRTETQTLGNPVHVEVLGALFPEMKPEEIVDHLTAMVNVERFQDIKVHISSSGAAYLYSTNCISDQDAIEKVVAEETQAKIADKVRQDSAKHVQLTAMNALASLFPELDADRVQRYAKSVVGAEDCQDIQEIIGPTGIAYLYSEKFMTSNYATILARVEAKNPYATIAETVREESRVYPRPTKMTLFSDPVFQIESDQMQVVVETLLRRPEYQDLKKIVASTGAIYLYSAQYLDPAAAQWQVEWEEVEKNNNP